MLAKKNLLVHTQATILKTHNFSVFYHTKIFQYHSFFNLTEVFLKQRFLYKFGENLSKIAVAREHT